MIRILINFSTLKKGGGQNVALNFLNSFEKYRNFYDVYFICALGSNIESYLHQHYNNRKILSLSQNPLKRMWGEITKGSFFCKENDIDIIYTYFGFGLFPRSIPQVIGSADSNLFFPEINFWSQYSGLKLLGKELIDRYRVYGLKRCDGIIFETELLERKCHELFAVKALTKTIKPSINVTFDKDVYILPNIYKSPKALLLCSWQLNKNIMIIPEVAAELKRHNFEFQFVITAPLDESEFHILFENKVKNLCVEKYINIIGPVEKRYLASLYQQIDIVVLLSKLESFSNNIIEAWTYSRALLVADEPWARDICKAGAYYVDRDNVEGIAAALIELSSNKDKYKKIVDGAVKILQTYPDIDEKTRQELDFIQCVYEKKH